jgi:glucokinase
VSRDLYLGIDTGGTAMKFALTDRSGVLVHEGEVRTQPADPIASLSGLAKAVTPLAGGEGMPRLAAVGLACAGIINPVTGHLGRSPNLPGWEDSPLGGHLRAVFGNLPQALANDVNGALYGEFRHGAGRGAANLIMIALGTGVGGGVIINGELVLGAHCGAGEIGHMVLDPSGPRCACGGRGCLEAYAGSTGILQSAQRTTGPGPLADLVAARGPALTTADLAALAEAGDGAAVALFAEAGHRLGQAVGNLVNVLDPDLVIIGGGVARAGDLILGPCREMVPGLVLAAEARRVPIVPAELGNLAASLGAATLAREQETAN